MFESFRQSSTRLCVLAVLRSVLCPEEVFFCESGRRRTGCSFSGSESANLERLAKKTEAGILANVVFHGEMFGKLSFKAMVSALGPAAVSVTFAFCVGTMISSGFCEPPRF